MELLFYNHSTNYVGMYCIEKYILFSNNVNSYTVPTRFYYNMCIVYSIQSF